MVCFISCNVLLCLKKRCQLCEEWFVGQDVLIQGSTEVAVSDYLLINHGCFLKLCETLLFKYFVLVNCVYKYLKYIGQCMLFIWTLCSILTGPFLKI